MKKFLLLIVVAAMFSSCYTVTRVGNCKYYTPKQLGSKNKQHKPIAF